MTTSSRGPVRADPPTRDRLLTTGFVSVFIANLAVGLSFFLFLHLPRLLEDLGASEVKIGVIISITAVVAVGARPVIGAMLDTRGRRRVAVAGAVLNLIAVLTYLTVTSIGPWLYLIRGVHGLAEAITFTAFFTIGADVVPESRRTEGLALFGVSGLLPIALGGLIGDLVLRGGNFMPLFLTAAGFAVLALGAATRLVDVPRSEQDEHPRGGFVHVLRDRSLLPVWWLTFSFSLSLAGYFVFIAVYVDTAGIGSVGAFFAAYVATAVGLRLAFAWVPARVGERKVLLPACISLALGLIVLAGATSASGVLAAGVLCGAGHGYVFPILFGAVVTRADDADRGSAMGLFSMLFDLGTLVGGPTLGFIVARADFTAMYRTAGIFFIVATVIYAVWDRVVTSALPGDM